MLSYMLPTDEKPPPLPPPPSSSSSSSSLDPRRNGNLVQQPARSGVYRANEFGHHHHHQHRHNPHHHQHQQANNRNELTAGTTAVSSSADKMTLNVVRVAGLTETGKNAAGIPLRGEPRTVLGNGHQGIDDIDETDEADETDRDRSLPESPRRSGRKTSSVLTNANVNVSLTPVGRPVVKDDSLYSIGSDASTVGSEKKHKLFNGAKHTSLKRVSFGSSKGSMVETLVYETPVQEEPENNHFVEHNGRLPTPITFGSPLLLPPDTDEGRERVRVSLLAPTPCPSTPGVLLLESASAELEEHLNQSRAMATSPVELLTTHTEHTTPTYHTQISTDSGWDNPFRPDGDLSREADEIVELIKGGKPITPTPGQNAPALPGAVDLAGCTTPSSALTNSSVNNGAAPNGDLDSTTVSPLLNSTSVAANQQNSLPRINHGNGNAHATPNDNKSSAGNGGAGQNSMNNQHAAHEKVATSVNAATVEVGRVTAQGPGDASQVEHVTLKKKPKCKCCVLQ